MAEQVSAAPRRRSQFRGWRLAIFLLAFAAIIAIIIRATVMDFVYVSSGSMEPTLQIDDRVSVNRLAYKSEPIQRGDIIVFDGRGSMLSYGTSNLVLDAIRAVRLAGDDTLFVKRVIGTSGDHVSCCTADGRVSVDDQPLDEPYLFPGNAPSEQKFDVVVPEGRVWVMGDHREISEDSRALLGRPGGGMIDVTRVLGRVDRIILPWDRARDVNQ
ncbi:signal peptidase I [Neomicrococcus lactis]|uniref:Signal peptidase I n=1 Tax=Neomicrococcus lactis TaxID=732241 RepID=A0A7W8YA07_9MICC|nr:signal peptidase I [Neomicrococcus lactis]MBB5597552.1 signal peptidase I [Neomicrococcus lactis]